MKHTYKIHSEIYGPYKNFSHILENTTTKKAIVFDPAWDANYISQRIENLGLELDAIWLTHGHHDHVSAIDTLRAIYPVPVFASQIEIDFINSFTKEMLPQAFLPIPNDTQPLHDGNTLFLGNIPVKIIHTPGHSPGSICFLLENDLITGDTLFVNGCGRADLPGSDPNALFLSLKKIIEIVPHHVRIHTGHAYGPTLTATLESQLKTNPFLTKIEQEDFISYRMSR